MTTPKPPTEGAGEERDEWEDPLPSDAQSRAEVPDLDHAQTSDGQERSEPSSGGQATDLAANADLVASVVTAAATAAVTAAHSQRLAMTAVAAAHSECPRSVRPMDRWVWALPAITLIGIGLGGEVWGPYGAIMAGLGLTTTLVLLVGGDVLDTKAMLIILSVCVVTATLVTVGRTWGIPRLSTKELPASVRPTQTRDAPPTTAPAAPHSSSPIVSTTAQPTPTGT